MIHVEDAIHLQQYVAQQTNSNKNGNMFGIGVLKKTIIGSVLTRKGHLPFAMSISVYVASKVQ